MKNKTIGIARGGGMAGSIGAQAHLVHMSHKKRRELMMQMTEKTRAVLKRQKQTKENAVAHFDPTPRIVKS